MIESVQYNAALAITGAIRGSSHEKLYPELGFESLRDRRYRKLCFYYKIRYNDSLYLTECSPIFEPSRTECFKATLFDNLQNNNMLLLPLENHLIVQILLFGSENYDSTVNKIIISSVMEFIIKSKCFEDALIQW